jgi:hypothetical protein
VARQDHDDLPKIARLHLETARTSGISDLLAGRPVVIRVVEPSTLLLFDLQTRALLRTRPNPLPAKKILRLRGVHPAGPPPRPAQEPVRVQRLADHTGVVSVRGQRVGLGRANARPTLTILVFDTTLALELGDGDSHVVRRTTTIPAITIKARSPRTVTQFPRPSVADHLA